MASPLVLAKKQFFDTNGDPLSGGKLYSYIAGTTTPLVTYSDADGATPNTNPVILDSAGFATIYLGNGTYKFKLANSADVDQYTIDEVEGLAAVSGAEESESPWSEHAVTDGMSATGLSGETVNFASYSSALYEVEIIRGTTVVANGRIAIQNVNGTGRLVTGPFIASEAHGVTFSISQAALVAQLRAATSSGPGAGTIKLSRRLIPA